MATRIKRLDTAFALSGGKKRDQRLYDEPEWRRIPFAPMYEVSNDGRVRRVVASPHHPAGRELRPYAGRYPKYSIFVEPLGKALTIMAHRLVGLVFLDAPSDPAMTMIIHANDDKYDNRVENLRWGTAADNSRDAMRNDRVPRGPTHVSSLRPWTRPRGSAHSRAKLTEVDIRRILVDERPAGAIARDYGVDSALIPRIKDGRVWRHVSDPDYADALLRGLRDDPTRNRRHRLSQAERQSLLEREAHRCHLCHLTINDEDQWDVSHEIPLELGGADDETNWRAAHRRCHREHTAKVDIPTIAKAKRIHAKHHGTRQPPRRRLGSSMWKRKINGKVVPR